MIPENQIICGDWHNCYNDSWQGIIVPEAFAHPAKMARGLTNRIFKHALSKSWIKPGDVVIDPFGGIGSTGIVGASLGLRVVCVELEEKFVDLGKQNFELNRKSFEISHFGHSYQPVIIQSDSRQLYGLLRVAEILLGENIAGADCVVGSPPYSEITQACAGHQDVRHEMKKGKWRSDKPEGDYGQTPGQLGAMKPGDIDCVVSSPPYAESNSTKDEKFAAKHHADIGRKINSPGAKSLIGSYGATPGNLGNLKPGEVDAVVSSPPYEDGLGHGGGRPTSVDLLKRLANQKRGYGKTQGQIENLSGQTFWAAAKQIVAECHKILKPGGHAIWVVKAFVRKGKIVDFPGDWRRLCEAQGFVTVCEHHAMLVKETRHNGLFEEIVETKERKSFFRRLAEKKGSPPIDYEVVLCMKKSSIC